MLPEILAFGLEDEPVFLKNIQMEQTSVSFCVLLGKPVTCFVIKVNSYFNHMGINQHYAEFNCTFSLSEEGNESYGEINSVLKQVIMF